MEELQAPQLPYSDRHLRACKKCHTVLTEPQFLNEGCRNCQTDAISRGDLDHLTTTKFHGCIGVVDSSKSWVARVVGLHRNAPSAVYAAYVEAEDSEEDDEEDQYDDDDDDIVVVGAEDQAVADRGPPEGYTKDEVEQMLIRDLCS